MPFSRPHSRFHSISARFGPSGIRTSFRRSSSASSRASGGGGSSSKRSSYSSDLDSPSDSLLSSSSSHTGTLLNSVIVRQPSIAGLEEERRRFPSELGLLEPRPIVYWGGLEERMGSF